MSVQKNSSTSFGQVFGPEVFRVPNMGKPDDNIALIEGGAMRHLKLGNLFIFDPDSRDDQCHLNGLRVAEIFRRFKKNTDQISGEDKRFLILSFLTSTVFHHSKEDLIHALDVILTKKKKGRLKNFVTRSETPARRLLNEEVQSFIDQKIQQIGREELDHLQRSPDLGTTHQGYFRFPKFPGLMLMLEHVRKEGFSFVFRIRLLCGRGFHTVVFTRSDPEDIQDEPVFVVEGVALNNGLTFSKYRELREKLPGVFGKGSEPPLKACPEGDKCSVVKEHHEGFTKLLEDEDKVLLSEGADFSFARQHGDAELFCSLGLKESYNFHLKAANELGLSGNNPRLLTIEHMICDIGRRALDRVRFVDTPPSALVEQRRLS